MQTASFNPARLACLERKAPKLFQPLTDVTRPNLKTEEAAHYLNRRPQTLRAWAMRDGTGPLRPIRVNGRLAWPVADIKRVLGVQA